MRYLVFLLVLSSVSSVLFAGQGHAAPKPRPQPVGKMKGINYVCYDSGGYSSSASDQALQRLAADGVNWIAVTVTCYQTDIASTTIGSLPWTPTAADLQYVANRAHALGIKVMLKPAVDLSNDPYHWRGDIGSAFSSESDWQAWFNAYDRFIVYYARLAKSMRADMLCVGAELCGTTFRAAEWRRIAADARRAFRGPLTYAANWGGEEMSITWWDALDYIGVNAYYPVSDDTTPTVASMRAAWTDYGYVQTLATLSARFNRQVLLTEIGYRSIDGAAMAPWDWVTWAPLDLQEQADAYQAAFEALWGTPWLAGAFWWYADIDQSIGGPDDAGYCPYNKPAETVLRNYYLAP